MKSLIPKLRTTFWLSNLKLAFPASFYLTAREYLTTKYPLIFESTLLLASSPGHSLHAAVGACLWLRTLHRWTQLQLPLALETVSCLPMSIFSLYHDNTHVSWTDIPLRIKPLFPVLFHLSMAVWHSSMEMFGRRQREVRYYRLEGSVPCYVV